VPISGNDNSPQRKITCPTINMGFLGLIVTSKHEVPGTPVSMSKADLKLDSRIGWVQGGSTWGSESSCYKRLLAFNKRLWHLLLGVQRQMTGCIGGRTSCWRFPLGAGYTSPQLVTCIFVQRILFESERMEKVVWSEESLRLPGREFSLPD